MLHGLELWRHFRRFHLATLSRLLAVIVLLASLPAFVKADVPANGLTDSEVLALLAGSTLPENIVTQIQLRGLAFHPSDDFSFWGIRSQYVASLYSFDWSGAIECD
jgi:hypothetical protein